MMVHTIPSGPFETNAYLIGDDKSNQAVLIDAPPGCFAQVESLLESEKRHLSVVLITHPHFDHVMDAGRFTAQGVPVFSHADAISGIKKIETFGLIPEPAEGFPEARVDKTLSSGTELTLADLHIVCLEVPGHSNGSLAFLISGEKACFVGDVIFRSSVGRTDLPGGDFDVLAESIQTKIYTLDEQTLLYPGHGPVTNVGDEKRSNPFVRL